MKHLLEISQLTKEEIEHCIQRALYFKNSTTYPVYSDYTVANLFYENSTRTRVSFEMAANHLSMPVINLDLKRSSESKGETIEDTLQSLSAMGIQHVVLRHSENGIQEKMAKAVGDTVRIINAGDGTHAHPSQALLDLMTIIEQKPHLSQLKIAILGNIKHSRVANSLQCIFKTMGIKELVMIAPKPWQPETLHYGHATDDLSRGLADADVVICLRVQKERFSEADSLDLSTYQKEFMLTTEALKGAKADAMVLHPGPVNRNIEIASDVVDGKQSFILKQVNNGVYTRMAILESLI